MPNQLQSLTVDFMCLLETFHTVLHSTYGESVFLESSQLLQLENERAAFDDQNDSFQTLIEQHLCLLSPTLHLMLGTSQKTSPVTEGSCLLDKREKNGPGKMV